MNSQTRPIHVWVPGIREGAGGIQAFSRIYVRALREAYPQLPLHVFVKNDAPSADDSLRTLGVHFHSVAHHHRLLRTPALVLLGLFLGVRDQPCCTVATHLHFLPALWLLRGLAGVPCAAVLHGIEAWHIKSKVRIMALRAADHLMAVSEFTREVVASRYSIGREQISVVPNTFDAERFRPGPRPEYLMERYGLTSDDLVLMTVSRLAFSERYKGHRQVLAALPGIRQHFPQVRYLIVGTGDDSEGIQNAAMARGMEDCVVMAGHVAGDELADHYRLCDVFVMPSSKEGFGIVFLEAMACGKPVVAGSVDGSVDAVDGGRLSPMVDPNDPHKIGQAILGILRREPPEAVWFKPEALSAAVVAKFGYAEVSRLMARDLATVVKGTPLVCANDEPSGSWSDATPTAPRVVIVVRSIKLARTAFFNALSAHGGFNLEVIYLSEEVDDDQAGVSEIAYNRIIVSNHAATQRSLQQAIRTADLVVFGSLASAFARRVLTERVALQQVSVFWVGTSDLQTHDWFDSWQKRWKLDPLHRHALSIWATSQSCISALRRDFGRSRVLRSVPLPVSLDSTEVHHEWTLDACVESFSAAVGDAVASGCARGSAQTSRACF